MKNLLNWEFSQTLKSKAFIGVAICSVVFNLVMLLFPDDVKTGFEFFLVSCRNISSFLTLIGSIYAGILVTGAFENRRVQAAVMAGNSRSRILAAKLASYAVSIAVFYLIPLLFASIIGFCRYGVGEMPNGFFVDVVLRGLVHMLVNLSFLSVCFLTSVLIKNMGISITVSLGIALLLNGAGEYLLEKGWTIAELIPPGQVYYVLIDGSGGNLLKTVLVSLAGIFIVLFLSYLKLRREELK